MRRIVPLLTGLLILQLGLALLLRTSGDAGPAAVASSEPLLRFAPSGAARIDIKAAGGGAIALVKRDGRWRLPGYFDLPANEELVEEFLERLAGLKRRFPLASSVAAAERFRVVAEDFERRIVLDVGAEAPLTLYLGDAPEFRRTAVRVEGDLSLYEAPLNIHEASVESSQWIDRELLYLDRKAVVGLQIDSSNRSVTLTRGENDQWEAAIRMVGKPVAIHPPLNQEGAQRFMQEMTELAYVKPLGAEERPAYRQQTPALRARFTLREGDPILFTFSRPTEGTDYVFKSSLYPHYFEVASAAVEAILRGGVKVFGEEGIRIDP